MATCLAFGSFLGLLLFCLLTGRTVAWAIVGGFAIFFLLGLSQKHTPAALWHMAWEKGKKSMIVVRVLLLIGMITGLWRACGTIACCSYYGLHLIPPKLFLLSAFLLTAAMSYLLGTSFGVASTAGVIIMALARSGGVSAAAAAGVVLSGIYFGDRCSPASSCASLVAAVTDTKLYKNVRRMWKTALLPLALTILFYGILSLRNPTSTVDSGVLASLTESFQLTWVTLLPAAAMLVLPLAHLPILWTLAAGVVLAAAVGMGTQGLDLPAVFKIALMGYFPADSALSAVMSGGGIRSLLPTYVVVLGSGLYSGILEEIGVLRPLEEKLRGAARRWGRLPVNLLTNLVCVMVFCNQTVMVILTEQILGDTYSNREELAMDLSNTGVTLCGLVPWAISCTTPLTMLGADFAALPYAVLLWLIPLCYLPTKRFFYPAEKEKVV